jgi:hypothetical protein
MELDLISEETAVLAKEKGFNIDTYRKFFECTDGSFEEANRNDFIHDHVVEVYNRPTQSLLQKVLKDDKGIFVYVTPILNKHSETSFKFTVYEMAEAFRGDIGISDISYEDALEKGLQQALKSI